MKLGPEVLIEDEALRDRLQNEQRKFTVAEKMRFAAALLTTRGATYAAPAVNGPGLERALAAAVRRLSISVSASETHGRARSRSPSRRMNH